MTTLMTRGGGGVKTRRNEARLGFDGNNWGVVIGERRWARSLVGKGDFDCFGSMLEWGRKESY